MNILNNLALFPYSQQSTAHQSGDATENSERQIVRGQTRRPEVALSISVADFR